MKKYIKMGLTLATVLSIGYSTSIYATDIEVDADSKDNLEIVTTPEVVEKPTQKKIVEKQEDESEQPQWQIEGNKATFVQYNSNKTVRTTTISLKRSEGTWQTSTTDVARGGFVNDKFVVKSHILTNYKYNGKQCSDQPSMVGCATKIKVTSYLGAANNQLLYQENYNGKLTSKSQWIRNKKQQLTEQRIFSYYPNGEIKRYEKRYGGRKLSTNYLSYNKTDIKNNSTNGRVANYSTYQNSLIYNGQAKTVLIKRTNYFYYGNGRVKNRNIYHRSAKYNKDSSRQYNIYRSNGKRYQVTNHYYNANGTRKLRILYKFNSRGQLKSNKYGRAQKIVTKYKKNKAIKNTKYKYNGAGKLKRIKK